MLKEKHEVVVIAKEKVKMVVTEMSGVVEARALKRKGRERQASVQSVTDKVSEQLGN